MLALNLVPHQSAQMIFPEDEKLDFFALPLRGEQFALDPMFLWQFEGKQPKWGPVGYVTYKRTYARELSSGQTEEFWQTCQRVVEGCYRIQQRHCQMFHLHWDAAKAQQSAQTMYRLMWEFKFLPPGRGLWMMGAPVLERLGGACLQNCGFVSTKDISQNAGANFADPFCWLMDMSMLGVGVGMDCRGRGTFTLQAPERAVASRPFVIPDTRRGWVDALRLLLQAYCGLGLLPSFDFSQIRPAGAPIRGFGGTASGPGPLRDLLERDLPKVLDAAIGRPITSGTIVDIANLIGKCVVSGNVRRSAEILFSDPTDEEFLSLKDPTTNAEALRSHRWASNNSVIVSVGQDYSQLAQQAAANGEPGFVWLENAHKYGRMGEVDDRDALTLGTNPCSEQLLENFELCNLVETFPSLHENYEEFQQTLKFAYLYAKTVTLIPVHDARTNAVQLRNRRIGTSITGFTAACGRHGRRATLQALDRGYKRLRELDKQYSAWLCIPPSVRVSTVKPSGTVSLLPGVAPGVHFPIAQYYIRRIRMASNSPLVASLRAAGYKIEPCVYTPDTAVVEFPVEEPYFTRSESDVTIWEQLENAAELQRYWSDNAVSVTVKFAQEEAAQLADALAMYEDRLKAVSFLPKENHGYAQAPYEEITREQYLARRAQLNEAAVAAGAQHDVEDKFCDGDRCVVSFGAKTH